MRGYAINDLDDLILMAYNEDLAAAIRKHLAKRKGLSEKKMFGGIAFMLNGNMCVGVHGDEMIVRLDASETDRALKQRHTRIFDLSGGRPMTGWILVARAGLKDASSLAKWIATGVEYASTLPAK